MSETGFCCLKLFLAYNPFSPLVIGVLVFPQEVLNDFIQIDQFQQDNYHAKCLLLQKLGHVPT